MALLRNEKNPSVTMFKGSEIIESMGFIVTAIIDNARPAAK